MTPSDDERPKTHAEIRQETERINQAIFKAIYSLEPSADPGCAATALLAAGVNVAIGCRMELPSIYAVVDGTFHAQRAPLSDVFGKG